MKRKPKPEKTVPVDPLATVFVVGDRCRIERPNLWSGSIGIVESVSGGLCNVHVMAGLFGFHADIPAAELKKLGD